MVLISICFLVISSDSTAEHKGSGLAEAEAHGRVCRTGKADPPQRASPSVPAGAWGRGLHRCPARQRLLPRGCPSGTPVRLLELTAWWGRGQTDDPNCTLPGDTASARAFLEAASPGAGGGHTGWRAAGAGRWPMASVSGHVRLGSDVPTGALGGLPPRLCTGLEPSPWGRRCGNPSGRG